MQGKKQNIFREDLLLANMPALMPKDPAMAREFNTFREQYRSFRIGKAKGSHGELQQFLPHNERTSSPPGSPRMSESKGRRKKVPFSAKKSVSKQDSF